MYEFVSFVVSLSNHLRTPLLASTTNGTVWNTYTMQFSTNKPRADLHIISNLPCKCHQFKVLLLENDHFNSAYTQSFFSVKLITYNNKKFVLRQNCEQNKSLASVCHCALDRDGTLCCLYRLWTGRHTKAATKKTEEKLGGISGASLCEGSPNERNTMLLKDMRMNTA